MKKKLPPAAVTASVTQAGLPDWVPIRSRTLLAGGRTGCHGGIEVAKSKLPSVGSNEVQSLPQRNAIDVRIGQGRVERLLADVGDRKNPARDFRYVAEASFGKCEQ